MRVVPPGSQDVARIVALVGACDVEELGAVDIDGDAVWAEWAEPGVDVARDAWLVEDDDGGLLAYGLLLGSDARAWVAPASRGRGAGALLARCLEDRARRRGLGAVVQQVSPAVPSGAALLRSRGYATVRSYGRWSLPADAAAALPAPAAGGPVRPFDPARDAAVPELVADVLRAAGLRPEARDAVLARPAEARSWWVAEVDGEVAGGALGELRPDGEGHIADLAVLEAHRGRGLAGALTAAVARDLTLRGAREAALWVRSDNPAALAVYARLGFAGPWLVEELSLEL